MHGMMKRWRDPFLGRCRRCFGTWKFKAICTDATFIWINAKRTPKQTRAPSWTNPKYAHFERLLSFKPILKKSIRCLDKIYRCQIYTFNSIQLNDFSKESNAMNDKSPNEIMEKLFKTQYLQESLQRYVMNSWQYTLHIKANTDKFHPQHNYITSQYNYIKPNQFCNYFSIILDSIKLNLKLICFLYARGHTSMNSLLCQTASLANLFSVYVIVCKFWCSRIQSILNGTDWKGLFLFSKEKK